MTLVVTVVNTALGGVEVTVERIVVVLIDDSPTRVVRVAVDTDVDSSVSVSVAVVGGVYVTVLVSGG